MIDTLVDQVQQEANIVQPCRVLRVSRAQATTQPATRQRARHFRGQCAGQSRIQGESKLLWQPSRVVDELKTQDIVIGRYKVRRLMREAGLKPVWKKKFVKTIDSKHYLSVVDNLLNRQFNPASPNQA